MIDAVLIQRPAIDFSTFLGLSHKALGYSPASASDTSRKELTDAERFVSCLAAFRDRNAPAGLSPNLLTHVQFSMFLVANEHDLPRILELSAGMPFVIADTVAPGIQVAVLTGNLAQWRDAVKSGLHASATNVERACYTKVMQQFEKFGLSSLWNDCTKKMIGTTLLLEDKRR